jgi:hypothetical protein
VEDGKEGKKGGSGQKIKTEGGKKGLKGFVVVQKI